MNAQHHARLLRTYADCIGISTRAAGFTIVEPSLHAWWAKEYHTATNSYLRPIHVPNELMAGSWDELEAWLQKDIAGSLEFAAGFLEERAKHLRKLAGKLKPATTP